MPDDIFDFHDSVIDQHPGDEAEREQRHGVEREAQKVQEPESRNSGQRNGNRGNDRRTPIAQEQEHNDDGEQCAFNHRRH